MLGMEDTNIIWEFGDEMFNLSNAIKVIKRGSVRIYPFLVMDYNEMFLFANILSGYLKDVGLECFVYEKNTYTFELNGTWNVVLSIKYTYLNGKTYYAMFSLINYNNENTYISPFYNIDYVKLNHHSIDNDYSLSQFNLLKDTIKSKFDNFRFIDSFP